MPDWPTLGMLCGVMCLQWLYTRSRSVCRPSCCCACCVDEEVIDQSSAWLLWKVQHNQMTCSVRMCQLIYGQNAMEEFHAPKVMEVKVDRPTCRQHHVTFKWTGPLRVKVHGKEVYIALPERVDMDREVSDIVHTILNTEDSVYTLVIAFPNGEQVQAGWEDGRMMSA